MGQSCGPMAAEKAFSLGLGSRDDGDDESQSQPRLGYNDNCLVERLPSDVFGLRCCGPTAAADEHRDQPFCRAMPLCGMTPRNDLVTPRPESFEFRPCEDLVETLAPGNPVVLHLYDLNPKLAAVNKVSYDLLGVGGAFHASVEVCGVEWSFGSRGLNRAPPRQRWQELYRQSVVMGRTECCKTEVGNIIRDMEIEGWNAEHYDVLQQNCGAFADAFCVRLNVGPIPVWVNRFAKASVSSDAWKKVASYLGCESAATQIANAPCQQRTTKGSFRTEPVTQQVKKKHPVPRLAMSPLCDATNRLPDALNGSPTRNPSGLYSRYSNKLPDARRSPKRPTPSKKFRGRRCMAFAIDDTEGLAMPTGENDSDERIVWHT